MSSSKKLYFYPVWLRIWHGFNALGIIILIFTGVSMESTQMASAIGFNLIINLHNIAGIVVSVGYLLFFIGNLVTSNGRFYLIKMKGFATRIMKQARYYAWGMFHGENHPFPLSEKRKFNPLQKLSYVIIMYMALPLVIVSGLALLFPEIIIERIYAFSGVFVTAIIHSAVGFLISIFLIVHLYIASIGKSPAENFKSIINGWHHVH